MKHLLFIFDMIFIYTLAMGRFAGPPVLYNKPEETISCKILPVGISHSPFYNILITQVIHVF